MGLNIVLISFIKILQLLKTSPDVLRKTRSLAAAFFVRYITLINRLY